MVAKHFKLASEIPSPIRIDLTANAVLLPLILMCCIAIFTVGIIRIKRRVLIQ